MKNHVGNFESVAEGSHLGFQNGHHFMSIFALNVDMNVIKSCFFVVKSTFIKTNN